MKLNNRQATIDRQMELLKFVKRLVRDTAYSANHLKNDYGCDENYSAMVDMYNSACFALKLMLPESEALTYIANTYQLPKS